MAYFRNSKYLQKYISKIWPLLFLALFIFLMIKHFINKGNSIFVIDYFPIIGKQFHSLQYELWESMLNYSLGKEQIQLILDQYYPYDNMNQKVFFFDPKLDKPYPKTEKEGIYGTEEVQKIIYENQYPKNCSERNFLLIPIFHSNGMGSYIHVIGSYIAKAIELNRTLVYDPNDRHLYSRCSECAGTSGFDCYFRPISSCILTKEEINLTNPRYKKENIDTRFTIPKSVQAIIEKTATPPKLYYFYWRIQAAYFMVRFNDNTKKLVQELREKNLVNPKDHYDVTMHIRRGNKYAEMKLIDTAKYRSSLPFRRR